MRSERRPAQRTAHVSTVTSGTLDGSGASADDVAAHGASVDHARVPGDSPGWLVVGLAVAYVAALLGLAFLPGGTLLGRLRALDGGICAQLPTHSFYPAGQQLPLCARNTGIYLGFSSTLLVLLAAGRARAARLPALWVALALGLAVAIMAVDGFNSLFLDLHLPHLYEPDNLLRLATGLGTGTAMAAFLMPIANDLLWRERDVRPSFGTFGQLSIMLPALLLAFLAVASQAAWLLYPLALLSSAGVVAAVSLVNLVFALALTGRIGLFTHTRQVFPVYSLAVVCAVVELLALFALKTAVLQALGTAIPA